MVILSKEVPFVPASAAFMVEHMARSTNFRCGRSVETRVRLSLLSASMGQTAPIQLRNLRPSHSLGFPLDGSELENVAWHRSPADALRASFKQSISCRNALDRAGGDLDGSRYFRTIHHTACEDGIAHSVNRLGERWRVRRAPILRTQNLEAERLMRFLPVTMASQVQAGAV